MPTAEYETFIANAMSIYLKFADASDQLEAGKLPLSPDPNAGPLLAYLIAYRLSKAATAILGAVSALIGQAVPGTVTYGMGNAHTTITDYRLERDAEEAYRSGGQSPLETMTRCVEQAIQERPLSDELACDYGPFLSNGVSVIATGLPTRGVWNLNQRILELLNERGIDAGGSWGAHATTARFTTDVAIGDPAITSLMAVLEKTRPLGNRALVSIEISSFYVRPGTGFEIFPYGNLPAVSHFS